MGRLAPPPDRFAHSRIDIVIVDDDRAVRESTAVLLHALGYTVRTYDNGADFLSLETGEKPFCLLLDMKMVPLDGFAVFERVKAMPATIPTLFLTGTGDIPMAVKAMRCGALDFLEKPAQPQVLEDAITRAMSVFADNRLEPPSNSVDETSPPATLTPREQDVLDLLVQGLTNKAIARELDISPRTVEIHRARVKQKLSASNLADLMRFARTGQSPNRNE